MPPPSPERLIRKTTSLAELLARRVRDTPDREAYRYPVGDQWRSMTWRQSGERVKAIAAGLLSLGLDREDRVGILCNTRVEWLLADLGMLSAGGATTTVYPSSTAEECAYILADSAARYVFVEDAGQLAKLAAHRAEMPTLHPLILIDGAPGDAHKDCRDWVMTLAELEAAGAAHLERDPRAVDDVVAGIQGSELATLIYTSGTTGKPKGVRLLHECWAYCADAIDATRLWGADDVQYLWLPMSHSFGKVLMAGHIASGSVTAVDGRIPKLVDNLAVGQADDHGRGAADLREGLQQDHRGREAGRRAQAPDLPVGGRRSAGPARRSASAAARRAACSRSSCGSPSAWCSSKIKATFGGRVKYFISGSAPLSREIAEFFHACGVLILEGYGLTETSAATFVNRPNKFVFGSVGIRAARHRVQARAGGRRDPDPVARRDERLPQPAGPDRRGADPRRLAAHRRHRRDRRRRLPAHHRSQEGPDQDLGRQVHRAAVDRGQAQGAVPVHQPGHRPRRPAQLRHRPGLARRGGHDEVGARTTA